MTRTTNNDDKFTVFINIMMCGGKVKYLHKNSKLHCTKRKLHLDERLFIKII